MGNRILVVRLSSLGDLVLTAPVFKNIKAHWPDARISVLVKPQFQAVLAGNPCIDEILVYRGLRPAVREIRQRGFTHLLDLHSNLRSFLIRTLARVPKVSKYRKNAVARRLFVYFRWSSPALVKHTLDRYLESLAPWGVPIRYRDLSLGDYGSKAAVGRPASKVLLAQTSFLGDTLLTLPLAKKIKEVLPGCRLSVLTRPQTADLFRGSPWVDEVIEDDKRGTHSGLRGLSRLSRQLRAQGFDLALVAHRSFRSALAMWLARIPYRIGFSSSAGWFFYHRTVYFSWGMPELERNLALLLPLKSDLKTSNSDSLFLAGKTEDAGMARRLQDEGVAEGELLIGLHPGSAWETKRWLPERYALLAKRFVRERGARVILIGGKEDAALARAIQLESGEDVVNLVGQTSLPQLMGLVRRLDLLVTNDSGPMHIAAASGVPTLAIFGPTTRELGFFPYGAGHRVLEKDLSCRPCGLHGARACPEGHFLCMKLIGVDEVFRNASEMLEKRHANTASAG